MLTRRVGLLVGAVIFMGTLGAGSMAPAQASTGDPSACVELHSTICVESPVDVHVDPYTVCVEDICVTRIDNGLPAYWVSRARELIDGTLEDVDGVLAEGVCVAPTDPDSPICVSG